jgi:hypothetical protein
MSKRDEQIRKALAALADPGEWILSGKVLSYDAEHQTIDLDLLDGRQRFDICLQASPNGNDGVILEPAEGSIVVVGRIANTKRYCLLNCNELVKIQWKIGDITMEFTEDGIVFNGGDLKGMVKIDALIEKINRLEQKVSTHQHAYVGGSGPAVTTADPGGSQLITPQTNYNDLANDKVKH